MKKKILCMALLLAAVAVSFRFNSKHEEMDSLLLENIEALASDEENGNRRCVGLGSVDCPISSVKVYMVKVYAGYSLLH